MGHVLVIESNILKVPDSHKKAMLSLEVLKIQSESEKHVQKLPEFQRKVMCMQVWWLQVAEE